MSTRTPPTGFANPDKNFLDTVARLERLYETVGRVRDNIGALAPTDVRLVTLNNIMGTISGSRCTLKLLLVAQSTAPCNQIAILGLNDPTVLMQQYEDLSRQARLFLLLESQFQIENCLKQITIALGRKGEIGYYNIATAAISASRVDSTSLDALLVPSFLRNSMHANGIHQDPRSQTRTIAINGYTYHFEHGKPVRHGSWFHIVNALDGAIDVLGDMLSTATVTSLPSIPDRYAIEAAP